MDKIIYKELCYKINGLLFKVHNELGRFCHEKQYADLFENKLKQYEIVYKREKILPLEASPISNRVDFCLENKIYYKRRLLSNAKISCSGKIKIRFDSKF